MADDLSGIDKLAAFQGGRRHAGGSETLGPPAAAEGELARRFAERHAHDMRYVEVWGRWLIYDGKVWRKDETGAARELVWAHCHEAAMQLTPRAAKVIDAAKTVNAVDGLARLDRRLAATADQWDRDLYILNTPQGVVDLIDGAMREPRPGDYCTKMTAVAPGGQCPRWLDFIGTTTDGDKDVQAYLQMIAGYSLCGDPSEELFFFIHGHGQNGKSVFIDTLGYDMGSYHMNAPSELLTLSHNDRHPTEMARLQGARLVTLSEIEPGKQWAVARLKMLSGRDLVTARQMYKDEFTYQPQCTLIIVGNAKPSLQCVGKAIERRMRLIPFAHQVPDHLRDPDLRSKLREEASGILQWAIDGVKLWKQRGLLVMPKVVEVATAEYLAAEDHIGRWFSDRCRAAPAAFTPSRTLLADYRSWAEDEGMPSTDGKTLVAALKAKGLAYRRQRQNLGPAGAGRASNPVWGFLGVELI
jgi:putative DNA primase/helicase